MSFSRQLNKVLDHFLVIIESCPMQRGQTREPFMNVYIRSSFDQGLHNQNSTFNRFRLILIVASVARYTLKGGVIPYLAIVV